MQRSVPPSHKRGNPCSPLLGQIRDRFHVLRRTATAKPPRTFGSKFRIVVKDITTTDILTWSCGQNFVFPPTRCVKNTPRMDLGLARRIGRWVPGPFLSLAKTQSRRSRLRPPLGPTVQWSLCLFRPRQGCPPMGPRIVSCPDFLNRNRDVSPRSGSSRLTLSRFDSGAGRLTVNVYIIPIPLFTFNELAVSPAFPSLKLRNPSRFRRPASKQCPARLGIGPPGRGQLVHQGSRPRCLTYSYGYIHPSQY